MFLGDGCVGDVSDVLEAEEETDETHPDDHHHEVEENVEVWLVRLVEVLNGRIICFVLSRTIGLLLNLLFKVKNRLNFRYNINISVQNLEQVPVDDHCDYERGPKLNDNSTFTGVPPNSELHRVILDVFDVLSRKESSSILLIDDAVVPVKQEIEVGGSRKDQIIRGIRTSPDFKHDILRKSRF